MWGVLKKDLAEFVGTVAGDAREALNTVLNQEGDGEGEAVVLMMAAAVQE